MQRYEVSGSFDKKGHLHLDHSVPIRNHKVKVIFEINEDIAPAHEYSLTEMQLTQMTMNLSEPSLKEIWEAEDDDYWNSYLKT